MYKLNYYVKFVTFLLLVMLSDARGQPYNNKNYPANCSEGNTFFKHELQLSIGENKEEFKNFVEGKTNVSLTFQTLTLESLYELIGIACNSCPLGKEFSEEFVSGCNFMIYKYLRCFSFVYDDRKFISIFYPSSSEELVESRFYFYNLELYFFNFLTMTPNLSTKLI